MAAGGMPILFPFPSKTKDDAYQFKGKQYHMPMHGLVKNDVFAVGETGENRARLWLENSPSWKAQYYPFDFRLEVEYRREKNSLIVPSSYEGRRVTLFEADVFQGHTRLASVVIPSSIMMIFDGSFSGCTRLQEIRLRHEIPCGVGQDLFAGTDGFRICVPADAVELFATHYNWGAYKEYLVGYES